MTLQAVGNIYWPPMLYNNTTLSATFGTGTLTFDSDTDRIAYIGRAPLTDTLATIYFRTATVTTGCIVDIRVETVSNGRPTGTLFGTNTAASVTIADSDDNVWKTATLTAAASMTVGDEFAIVMTVDTAGATPNLALQLAPSTMTAFTGLYPALLQDPGTGTWAATVTYGALCWICEFGTQGVYPMNGMMPINGGGTITAFNSGSSPDEIALRFQVPFKCRVIGLNMVMLNIAAGADFTFSLWPASSTTDGDALEQVSEDGDVAVSTTADGTVAMYFNAPVTLNVNTTYYAGLRADTANNISIGEMTTATVTNAVRGFQGINAQTYRSSRAWSAGSAGAWTDVTTTVPLIFLILDQLDDGAGGSGGLLTHPGMSGGMRG